jgi:3-phenylpropionate/trans-cinnamate dioxygenase ferredoxin reductase subunit
VSDPMLIVGAGQAGLYLAEQLRTDGFQGPVLLVGEEPHTPYNRPPLSKAALVTPMTQEQLIFRRPEVLVKKQIELITNTRVTAVDRIAKRAALSDGRTITYAGLAFATGSRARPLPVPGADLAGIAALRTLEDSRAIAAGLAGAKSVVVVGGGFIGLEVAAAARKFGKPVTVFEATDRLMGRAVAPVISEYFLKLHREHGVDIRLDTKVEGFVGNDGHVSAVATEAGEVAADFVVIGIGIIPNAELAQACGLTCNNGIVVDHCSRTSDPAVVAAGDCTARLMEDGTYRRLESVQNAIEQAKSASAALLGQERPFTVAPYFWSDQFEVKLQMAGSSAGADHSVVRGSIETKSFSIFYFKHGRLIGGDSINRGADHLATRKLLDAGISPTAAQAADETFMLISLASKTAAV